MCCKGDHILGNCVYWVVTGKLLRKEQWELKECKIIHETGWKWMTWFSPRDLKSNGFQTVKMGSFSLNMYTRWNLETLNPGMTQSYTSRLMQNLSSNELKHILSFINVSHNILKGGRLIFKSKAEKPETTRELVTWPRPWEHHLKLK